MASEKHVNCGPCRFDDITRNAGIWCTSCDEGLCDDCENVHRKSKISRNHQTISIDEYHKIDFVSISQICEHHGENFEWFCKTHDAVICMVCVHSNHKSCSDVISISVASTNARQSTILTNLEETIDGTLHNVQQCINDRQSATNKVGKQELAVKTMILKMRKEIESYLDMMQEKLLRELKSSSETCKSNYIKFIQKLESMEETLTELKKQILHMKQYSSDIQVFLGTRRVNELVGSEIDFIKSEIAATMNYELKVAMNTIVEKFSKEVKDFGLIKVSETTARLDLKNLEIYEARIGVTVPTSNISDIKLQHIKTFQIKRKQVKDIRGCAILPNGHLLIANYTEAKHLLEYTETGEYIHDIPVSYMPYDIAVIYPNRIVLTYGTAKVLEIINYSTFDVENKVTLEDSCYGVSKEDGRLYVVVGNSTIQVLDLSGRQLKTLEIPSKSVLSITTNRDRIFYTDNSNNKVHCCRMNGIELWQFQSKSITFPYGAAVDNNHDVYVVGFISDNLTIIHHNGRVSKTLLTVLDGLVHPKAVYFDKYRKKLLLCNEGGMVALYEVVYNFSDQFFMRSGV